MRWQSSISAAFPEGQGTFPRATVILTKQCTKDSGQPGLVLPSCKLIQTLRLKTVKTKASRETNLKHTLIL